MGILHNTFQQIANILSFETSSDNLNQSLSSHKTDWDSIVRIGSKHLVLPAIYCRLKYKKSLHLIPKELNSYLEEITQINRNRNLSLLNEAIEIQKLFTENDINFTFLKGIALVAGDYYEDIGERMIGDIDILVANDKLDFAYNLLLIENYHSIPQTINSKYFKDKHLPRLVNTKKLGAVELHKNLFNQDKSFLLDENNLLIGKRLNFLLNIPSPEDLLSHNVLNHQLNDHGFYFNSLSLRSAYDSIIILQKDKIQLDKLTHKYYKRYFNILSVFFKAVFMSKNNIYESLILKFYILKVKFKKIGILWYYILINCRFLAIFTHRLYFMLRNKNYKRDILKDQKRIRSLLLNRIKKEKD